MNDPKKIVGHRIRVLRQNAKLSQEALAAVCGLHRIYIGAVERGERNISLLNIVAISRALGVKPASLLKEIE